MKHVVTLCTISIIGAVIVLSARWIAAHYVAPSERSRPSGAFHNPAYRRTAELALRRFAALTPAEQASIRQNLEANVIDASVWIEGLNRSRASVVCFGEDHEDATRRFVARTVFRELDLDTLMLEVTDDELGRILQRIFRWKRKRVPLLDADIAEVVRIGRRRNAELELVGIEETKAQRLARLHRGSRGTRDRSISTTFWGHFQRGRRYAILFGALHCTRRREWLYGRIRHLAPQRVAGRMVNVRVLEKHQNGSVEALAFFLDAIGVSDMSSSDAVVVDSKAIHAAIRRWFKLLARMLEDYRYLMIFDERRQAADGRYGR